MKRIFIKLVIIISIFLFAEINCYAATLENLDIEIDKEILHPKDEVTINIDFGRSLSEFEIDIAYDKNLFEYFKTDKDINLQDNGDIVTLTYPTISTTDLVTEIAVTFKVKENITSTNPTDFKITLQNMKDGLTEELIDNPLLPTEKSVIVEPIYKEYKIDLKYDKPIIPNEESVMKLILKSDMGQNYSNTKIYATIDSDVESEAKIYATDTAGKQYNFLEEGWGGDTGEPIGGANVVKELALTSMFSDEGDYKITFELIDINNSDSVIASETFNIEVNESNSGENSNQSSIEDNVGKLENNLVIGNKVENLTNEISNTTVEEIEFKPTTLPKAGSTIYFLILPIGGILILIYCLFKKKDDEL